MGQAVGGGQRRVDTIAMMVTIFALSVTEAIGIIIATMTDLHCPIATTR